MSQTRRSLLAAGATLATLGSAATAKAQSTVKVRIPAAEAVFKPAEVTIKVGDTVEWTNRSAVAHTVTCDPAKPKDKSHVNLPAGAATFDSGEIELDGTWKHTFTKPGTYKYCCLLHEDMNMVGTVVVA